MFHVKHFARQVHLRCVRSEREGGRRLHHRSRQAPPALRKRRNRPGSEEVLRGWEGSWIRGDLARKATFSYVRMFHMKHFVAFICRRNEGCCWFAGMLSRAAAGSAARRSASGGRAARLSAGLLARHSRSPAFFPRRPLCPPLAPLLPPPLTEGRPFATLPSCHSRQRLLAPTQVSPPPPRARRLTRGRPLRLLAGEPLHLLARVRSRAGAPRLLARGRPLCPLVRRRFPCRLACVLLVMGVFRPVGRGAAVGGGWGAVRLARLRIWKS